MNNHEEIRELLSAAALNELNEAQAEQIEKHIQTCQECRQELERMKEVLAIAGQIRDASLDDAVCREAKESVLEMIKGLEQRQRNQYIWLKYAVAAVLILGAWLVLQCFMGDQKLPQPPQAHHDSTQPKQIETQTEEAVQTARLIKVQSQQKLAEKLFAAQDVTAMAALYRVGEPETKEAVLNYLRRIDTDKARAMLTELEQAKTEPVPEADVKDEQSDEEKAPETESSAEKPDALQAGLTKEIETPLEEQEFYDPEAEDLDNWQSGILGLRVIDDESGEPIFGAALDFSIRPKRDLPKDAKTNQFGRYELKHYTPDARYLQVKVRREPYASVGIRLDPQETGVTLPLQYELRMKKGVTVGGVVRTLDGEPLEGVTVDFSMYIEDNSCETYSVNDKGLVTDVQGHWQLDGFPPDIYPDSFGVSVEHPDYVPLERYSVHPSVEALMKQDFVIEMRKGLIVQGYVRDTEGHPIEGAVVFTGSSRYDSEKRETKTNADGFYEIRNCHPSDLLLTVSAKGYAPELREVSVNEKLGDVEFVLESGHTVTVRAVNSQGCGIGGVEVQADEWRYYSSSSQGARTINCSAKTNASGYAQLTDMPADEVKCSIHKSGYAMYDVFKITAGEQDAYELVMLSEGKLTGRVLDAETGFIVPNCYMIEGIRWEGQEEPTWQSHHRKLCPDGLYEQKLYYQDLSQAVRIEAEGYLPAHTENYTNDGSTFTEDVLLYKGTGPSGMVYLPNGEPAEGADVALINRHHTVQVENGRLRNRSDAIVDTTDKDGLFQLMVADEPWRLVALHEAGFAVVTQGEFTETGSLTLQPWGSIEGIVYQNNQPAARQTMKMHPSYQPDQVGHISYTLESVTGEDGRFRCDRVPPGRVQVSRSIPSQTGRSSHYVNTTFVQVEPNKTAFVEIGKDGRTVTGTLMLPESMQADSYKHIDLNVRADFKIERLDPPQIQIPENYFLMTMDQRQQWQQELMQTEMYKEYIKKLEAQSRTKIDVNESVIIQPDGTLRIENIPAGNYRLYGRVGKPGLNRYDNGWYDNIVGTIDYEFTVPPADSDEEYGKPVQIGEVIARAYKTLQAGQKVPDLALTLFDGPQRTLQDYQGFWLLIDFGGPGMPGYLEETLPALQEAVGEYKDSDQFALLTMMISSRPYTDSMDQALRYFVQEKHVTWLLALVNYDPYNPSVITEFIQNGGYPSLILIGPDGTIAAVKIKAEELRETLEKHISPEEPEETAEEL